jgi:hypothetical protein
MHIGIAGAEDVDRAANAAAEIEHPPRAPLGTADGAFGVAVRERLAGVIARDRFTEQVLEVVAGEAQPRGARAA